MLKLHNTMSRRMEPFKPRQSGKVKMFTCGPSIYRPPHLGNYRTFLWEDALQRYLQYLGYHVERVINLTDIEDKAIEEAERSGKVLEDLTEGVSIRFFEEASFLKMELPDHIPRSSTSVDQAVYLIEKLMEKGIAYRHGNDIFYDPLKFPGFGKLYGLDMSRWPKKKVRFKKDTYPGRRWNLGDFILWHGHKPGSTIYWESSLGKGRPSWNIQDPAIITDHLGYEIDISCGGVDNLYRHHDYNIAVIEGVTGREFSRYWVHGEHLLAAGKKMSKSLNNIIYPHDMVKEGYSAEQIRFYLLCGHHRRPMNFKWKNVEKSASQLDRLRQNVQRILDSPSRNPKPHGSAEKEQERSRELLHDFEVCMNEDLNMVAAVDALQQRLTRMAEDAEANGFSSKEKEWLRQGLERIDGVFQFIFSSEK